MIGSTVHAQKCALASCRGLLPQRLQFWDGDRLMGPHEVIRKDVQVRAAPLPANAVAIFDGSDPTNWESWELYIRTVLLFHPRCAAGLLEQMRQRLISSEGRNGAKLFTTTLLHVLQDVWQEAGEWSSLTPDFQYLFTHFVFLLPNSAKVEMKL